VKVLVCGSRRWLSQKPIERELRKLPPRTVIIHGAAAGADNIAGFVAEILGFEVRPYPADWDRYKGGAGPIRNGQMLKREHPDADGVCIDKVLAFHEDPDLGKGTRHMVGLARRANPTIVVEVFHD
jgi:hypothetical protein